MQQEKTTKEVEFCLERSRHEMQLAPVEMDPPYEKAFYSQGEDWTCGHALNTTAWD